METRIREMFPMDDLHLLAHRTDDTVTIAVGGELDIATKPALVTFLQDNLRDSDDRVTLDLSGLKFIDAGGLGLLVGVRVRAQRQDTVLSLIGTSDHFRRLLQITGLDAQFTIA
jgi:anti-sigma B factor antagonist